MKPSKLLATVRTSVFRHRVEKPKKGRCSYTRKKQEWKKGKAPVLGLFSTISFILVTTY
jgi:stalled ribosome alternative rescue factor ArfA